MPTQDDILNTLKKVEDPDLHRDIVSLGFVRNIKISKTDVSLDINLTTPACPVKDQLKEEAQKLIESLPDVKKVTVNMTAETPQAQMMDKSGVKGIRNFILVASGKGGVGKSTVAANLAVGMAQAGAKVGLLDADIYGPTVPILMGPKAEIDVKEDNTIVPAQAHGIKFVSMGFMAPGDKPLIWRGPMAHHALQQTLFQTEWGELDYLFLDLPPGTGDVHLTLTQSIPATGAVLVSTPQDLGLTISLKTYQMFKTTHVPILGIVENMSYHQCSKCGHQDHIFGHGSVEQAAKRLKIPFLGEIPLHTSIREKSDQGSPIVTDNQSDISKTYKTIVGKLASQVSIANFEGAKIKIVDMKNIDERLLKITWGDDRVCEYSARTLRQECHCAACRNELTGELILNLETVPKDIKILKAEPVGNYALGLTFSDQHASGIYSFDHLRKICPSK